MSLFSVVLFKYCKKGANLLGKEMGKKGPLGDPK